MALQKQYLDYLETFDKKSLDHDSLTTESIEYLKSYIPRQDVDDFVEDSWILSPLRHMAEKNQANYANMITVLISVISNGQNFLDAAERVLIYAPETSQEFLSGYKPSLTLKVVKALKTSHSQWSLSCDLLYILENRRIEVDENRLWICDVMNLENVINSDQTFKDNLYTLMEDINKNIVEKLS